MMNILKALKPRTKEEIARWTNENFNLHDVDNICEDEVAREVRALTIRISMYMEIASDSQKQTTAISIISILISACAVIVSAVVAVAR